MRLKSTSESSKSKTTSIKPKLKSRSFIIRRFRCTRTWEKKTKQQKEILILSKRYKWIQRHTVIWKTGCASLRLLQEKCLPIYQTIKTTSERNQSFQMKTARLKQPCFYLKLTLSQTIMTLSQLKETKAKTKLKKESERLSLTKTKWLRAQSALRDHQWLPPKVCLARKAQFQGQST